MQDLSFFLQDYITAQIGGNKLEIQAGVRSISQLAMDKAYEIQGKIYFDPRVNVQWSFPNITIGEHALQTSLAGGYGKTTKMPTLDYLYPNLKYTDITQLAYYDVNKPEENSRYNILTYIRDITNYDLKPARNTKWEVRGDVNYRGNRLSVTFFREEMLSGFRYSNYFTPYAYKDYDESSIESSSLQGPPALSDIPYQEKKKLMVYSFAENGSKLVKKGIEFQFNSQRIKALRTGITVNGAWFKSIYSNSRPMYERSSAVVDGQAVSDIYVGLYDWNDGKEINRFTSKILFDTQIPEWGLIFSTSVDCSWFVNHRTMTKNGIPVSYIDANDGLSHIYDEEAIQDIFLQQLILRQQEAQTIRQTIPIACYLNLKMTKKIGKWLDMAFFANRLFDYTPDYTQNGYIIRRNSDCYFGMELNFKL
ncbi:TonB-dependent receptor [Bacteroidales bacterium OttesenSCG-928-I14]|nr:TonB-dependent receptor [Bacteroidales bacterium OttesenSCG-928-I14]